MQIEPLQKTNELIIVGDYTLRQIDARSGVNELIKYEVDTSGLNLFNLAAFSDEDDTDQKWYLL